MTNKLLLLAAAGTLAFASCQSDVRTTGTDEEMQAKIDSAVQARMTEMQAQLAAQNDSLINAVAMMRADSMMASAAAAGNNNTGMRRTVPTRPSTSPRNTTNTGTPRTEQDRKFENRENGNPSGQTISPDKAKEQDDKFNRRGGGN
jgi:hypothetical protein